MEIDISPLGILCTPVNPAALYPLLFPLSKQIEIHIYNLILMTLGNKGGPKGGLKNK